MIGQDNYLKKCFQQPPPAFRRQTNIFNLLIYLVLIHKDKKGAWQNMQSLAHPALPKNKKNLLQENMENQQKKL